MNNKKIICAQLERNIKATAEYIGSVYQRCLKRKRLYDRGEGGDDYPATEYESDKYVIALTEKIWKSCKEEYRTDIYLGWLSEYPNEDAKANLAAVTEFVQKMDEFNKSDL